MALTESEICRRYRCKLRKRVLIALGKRACILCGKRHRKLEAAHIAPTRLDGAGRGITHRYLDIIKHPEHYRWMGKKCHHLFDKLMEIREALRVRDAGEKTAEGEEEIPF